MDAFGVVEGGELLAVREFECDELAQAWFRSAGWGYRAKLVVLDLAEGEVAEVGHFVSVSEDGVATLDAVQS